MPTSAVRPGPVVSVERWPSELPLLALVTVVALALWLALIVSVIGIVYVVLLGVFFFLAHVMAVAHIRGNAVRLGPDQLPDLHNRVVELAGRFGMDSVPEAYLMQAGGALNAFATRFLGADMVVLYSDLIEACGDDHSARDMIIAHELGHLHAGHLKFWWLRAPGESLPFLGHALARAREYTCDRYGLVGAGSSAGALLGLTILASGPERARDVNRQGLVRQQEALNTGWMRIGEWLMRHPPLARRLAALEPALAVGVEPGTAGTMRALAIMAAAVVAIGGGTWAVVRFSGFAKGFRQAMDEAAAQRGTGGADPWQVAPEDVGRLARARSDLGSLAAFIIAEYEANGSLPDEDGLWARWAAAHPGEPALFDAFADERYRIRMTPRGPVVSSAGLDGVHETGDDLVMPVKLDLTRGRSGGGTGR